MSKKKKLIILQIMSFLCIVLPITIYVFVNHAKYFKSPGAALNFTLGGSMLLLIIGLTTIGKASSFFKANKALWVFAILLFIAVFLEPIILDLKIISFLLLSGELVNFLLLTRSIRKLKEEIKRDKDNGNLKTIISETISEHDDKRKGGRV